MIFRSRSLRVAGIILGAFFAIIGLPALVSGSHVGGAAAVLVGIAIGVIFARVRLVARPTGIEIYNPLRKVGIRWNEIARFKLGRHGLLSTVCVVELKDGSSSYSFAIQSALAGVGKKELKMVDELNALLLDAKSTSGS